MLSALAFFVLTTAKVDANVVYSRPAGFELKMDIYYPEPSVATKAAVVVFHGGAWMFGDKSEMREVCQSFAKQGILAAAVQYRLAPKTRWPGFYDDGQTAVRYLRENAAKYRIDPKRIGACGASAGGHVALLLGFTDTRDPKPKEYPRQSSRVSAVIDVFGPSDMTRDYPKSYDMLFMAILGKPRAEASAEITAASPVSFIDRRAAPVFIIHGKADPMVPVAQSQWLEQKLKSNGTQCVCRYIDGLKHELPASNAEVGRAVQEAIAWLKTQLTK
jgi:acetyl esterase/lipase